MKQEINNTIDIFLHKEKILELIKVKAGLIIFFVSWFLAVSWLNGYGFFYCAIQSY